MTDDLAQALRSQRLKTGLMNSAFINPRTGAAYTWRSTFIARLCRNAGVQRFGFHAIRHLTASIQDKENVPLSAIQAVLRHKSSHTTAGYLHSLVGIKVELNRAFSRHNLVSPRSTASSSQV